MLLTKKVTVNLGYRDADTVLDGVQGDSGRALQIGFMVGETAWPIPEDTQVLLQYACEDGTGGIYDTLPDGTPASEIGEDDSLTVMLISQLFAVAGTTRLQVTLLNGGVQISTFPVLIRISPSVTGEPGDGMYVNLQKWLLDTVYQESFVAAVVQALPDGDEVSY